MDAFAAIAAAVFLLAPAVTKFVDTIRNAVDPGGHAPKVVWNLVAFASGVALCLVFGLNYVPLIEIGGHTANLGEVAGQVVTGLVLGGVASGWHEKFDLMSSTAKAKAGNVIA
jgi:uncharacterized transporter YbjL